jgi:pimeloyl-ACP methyl ester carboxylesterase
MIVEDKFVDLSGVSLFTRKLIPDGSHWNNEKPVVVFLHEGLGSVEQWKDFPGKFLEKCHVPVLLYDRLGYGKSSPRKERRGIDYIHQEEKLLRQLIAKLTLKKYYLLGHSEGGSLALIHAAQHPNGLLKVITLSANTQEEPRITPGIEDVRRLYEKPGSKLKKALQKYHGERCNDVFYAWCDTWTAGFFQSWNIKAELGKIQVQVLALHGLNDQYTSLQQIENIRQLVPSKKEIHILGQCSHHPHFDHPEEVLRIIQEFLKQD